MFDPVIDRSPIDKFNVQANVGSLMQMAGTQQMRGNELYDMHSTRNQMFKDQAMKDSFDVQAQQGMMAQRQAARSGQAFTPAGMETMGKSNDGSTSTVWFFYGTSSKYARTGRGNEKFFKSNVQTTTTSESTS